MGPVSFREWVPFYLDWAALRLSTERLTTDADIDAVFVCGNPDRVRLLLDAMLQQDHARLRSGLRRLVGLAQDAQAWPLAYFPRTAWAWATAVPEARLACARKAWESTSDRHPGERDYAPGYTALLARGIDLLDAGGAAYAAFVSTVRAVAGVLDPAGMVLLPGGTGDDNDEDRVRGMRGTRRQAAR
jgi:exodeoxyribonuclease V gamma subunit